MHYVLDEWFQQEVLPQMQGRAYLVRYAEDAAMVFQKETDARRVMAVLAQRCAKFGLTIHPEKTRLIDVATIPTESNPPQNFPTAVVFSQNNRYIKDRRPMFSNIVN